MAAIIDANSHVTSDAILEAIAEVHDTEQATTLRSAPRLYDLDHRIDYLDRFGIDQQVINIARPTVFRDLTPEESLDATKVGNDEMRRIADEHPDRLIPMGTVPFLTGEYLDEARRCVDDLGFRAIQVFSNVNGQLLDDDAFEPFWATVDDLDVPVWIHPQIHPWHEFDVDETWIYKAFGWPFDTTIALARIVYSGLLDRHRNVEIVSHHLGGTLPYLVGRFLSWYQTRQEEPDLYADQAVADLEHPLEAYVDRLYGDTAVSTHGESSPLECGLDFFGPDNVVYCSDYPLGPDRGEFWPEQIMGIIDGLDVPEAHKRKIYSENVSRLLDL